MEIKNWKQVIHKTMDIGKSTRLHTQYITIVFVSRIIYLFIGAIIYSQNMQIAICSGVAISYKYTHIHKVCGFK